MTRLLQIWKMVHVVHHSKFTHLGDVLPIFTRYTTELAETRTANLGLGCNWVWV